MLTGPSLHDNIQLFQISASTVYNGDTNAIVLESALAQFTFKSSTSQRPTQWNKIQVKEQPSSKTCFKHMQDNFYRYGP